MPVLGKDTIRLIPVRKQNEFRRVKATLVHTSKILPSRQAVNEVIESVEKDGIQHPIVVRPHPTIQGAYEIIDGVNRFFGIIGLTPGLTRFAVGNEPEIMVDLRYGISDVEMFKLSKSFHTRGERNTYEQAEFYAKWVEAKEKELGKKEGVLIEVAKEINPGNVESGQAGLSQYLKVYEMFEKLEKKYPLEDLNALKSLGLNRLYAMTALLDNEPKLLDTARKLKKNPEASLERIKEWTHRDRTTDSTTPERAYIRLPAKETTDLKKALYKLNADIFENDSSHNEILTIAVTSLVKHFLKNPSDYEADIERIPRKGCKFNGLLRKSQKEPKP